jgi:hypothetical protein
MRGIFFLLAEDLLASHERLCSTEFVFTYCTSSALALESPVASNVPEGTVKNTLHSDHTVSPCVPL